MFLAVDGVAPRAKMNQQRSRRFRSAKDAERALAEAIARDDPIPSGIPFDSNCITPGTEFMYRLSNNFRRWIDKKMRTDPVWQQGCTVVFSGSEVPGEGEHKIMDYIRAWKKTNAYSPEIRHCMYGLDADLMMLGLVAHAPHFTLLREKMKFTKSGRKTPEMKGTSSDADEFQLLEISMLRDMLYLEFKRGNEPPFARRSRSPLGRQFDTDSNQNLTINSAPSNSPNRRKFRVVPSRIVDDFVFMCMLVGNDFLPHLPHLDIAEGAINVMFRVYKDMLPAWGDYLTDRHRLHHDRLQSFLKRVGDGEQNYFELRARTDDIPEYKDERYRRAYYREKFGFDVNADDAHEKLRRLRRIYMEGLHWVLQYYHNGVSSWNWYYPDFYAILASDMVALRKIKVQFERGRPFRPLTQLMAVLPPESSRFLPEPMRDLMVNPQSPVADFYPVDFETDQNGKRNAWEAVVIVPFIEEDRLLGEVKKINRSTEFTHEERQRDRFGPANWFHARDYPSIDYRIPPVRSSIFDVRTSYRGRSQSPQSEGRYGSRFSGARNSRSPSPRGQGVSRTRTEGRSPRTGSGARTKEGGGPGRKPANRNSGIGTGGGRDGSLRSGPGSRSDRMNRDTSRGGGESGERGDARIGESFDVVE